MTAKSLEDQFERSFEQPAMLVVAHPDDEILAAGARLHRYPNLTLIHVTDGAPRNLRDARHHGFDNHEEYALARRRELECALREARANPEVIRLSVPDQETAFNLVSVTQTLTRLIEQKRPGMVMTHAYEGGHPDHDCCAFAVQTAVSLLPLTAASVWEFPSYHLAGDAFLPGVFLPDDSRPVLTYQLTPEEQQWKRRMLACFRTQRETLAQFSVETERFRLAPSYDFTRAPHAGPLYYERFPWGIDGAGFRRLAAEAL